MKITTDVCGVEVTRREKSFLIVLVLVGLFVCFSLPTSPYIFWYTGFSLQDSSLLLYTLLENEYTLTSSKWHLG